jgi:hypothetical protein
VRLSLVQNGQEHRHIRTLPFVGTLGSVTAIFSDTRSAKNEMTLAAFSTAGKRNRFSTDSKDRPMNRSPAPIIPSTWKRAETSRRGLCRAQDRRQAWICTITIRFILLHRRRRITTRRHGNHDKHSLRYKRHHPRQHYHYHRPSLPGADCLRRARPNCQKHYLSYHRRRKCTKPLSWPNRTSMAANWRLPMIPISITWGSYRRTTMTTRKWFLRCMP